MNNLSIGGPKLGVNRVYIVLNCTNFISFSISTSVGGGK